VLGWGRRVRWTIGIALAALSAVYAMLALGLGMIAPMSFMALDAPGSESRPQVWAFVIGMLSLPVLLLAGPIVGWVLFLLRRTAWALARLLLPIPPGTALLALFAFAASLRGPVSGQDPARALDEFPVPGDQRPAVQVGQGRVHGVRASQAAASSYLLRVVDEVCV
jgi:hypothetical protein